MRLGSEETRLVGRWERSGDHFVEDAVALRIRALVREQLVFRARSADGWDALYEDPADGRLWELIYPAAEMHGGGPPELRHLSAAEAKTKYGTPD